jgi:hypothetical protein
MIFTIKERLILL